MNTTKHKLAEEKMKTENKSASMFTSFCAKSQFSRDLCKAFIHAGIPLWKLENKSLRQFLEKYTKQHVPSESTLRKNFVDENYSAVIEKIRCEIACKRIWISIDETTDPIGRYVANVIIGTMEATEPPKHYLLTSEVLDRSNSSTISQLFVNSLAVLWPGGVKHDNVLLLVTDAAPYMKKAAAALKILFPKMMHLTCLAHGLHRVAEHIRSLFPDVDRLVSNVKKVFLKAPSRVQLFKEMAPEIPLPPQPVLTRWGTWLSAALYYAANFTKIQDIINCFAEEESTAVQIVRTIIQKKSLHRDLVFLASHFVNFPTAITILENREGTLVNKLQTFDNVIDELRGIKGKIGEEIEEKCRKIVLANKELSRMQKIALILKGDSMTEDIADINMETVPCFKHAPVTSAEVERSFSQLKYILSDRRLSLTADNLKKLLVVMANQQYMV